MEDLVAKLTTTTLCDDILCKITNIFQNVDNESLLQIISDNFNSLFTLEHWAWKILSSDFYQWINQSKYFELFNNLAAFNKKLIFTSIKIDSEKKASLLIPQTKELIKDIFEQIEKHNNDNDSYFIIISLWLDNLSYFMYEDTQYLMSTIITDMEYVISSKFVMVDQYKFYLNQLHHSILTYKQLFYLRTCSFFISSYLFCKHQKFPFTGDDILRYLADDYLELIEFHSFTIQSWNKELLSCITHSINFICSCCSWGSDREKCIKILLPSIDISHKYIQSLIRIIGYKPFYEQIQVQRSNDETILIDVILNFLLAISEVCDLVCFMRYETKLLEILLLLVETSKHIRINLYAYGMLGQLLSDEHLKELKITNDISEYFFYMLEHAWNHPEHNFQRTSVPQLLRGFLNLAKNDSIQQNTADTNRITLFFEMCDEYPVIFDILWALSFNHDIQEQLRSNRQLMFKLTHLKQELNNPQMRKIANGILWNLESLHEDRAVSEENAEIRFDIMISYSHNDKILCKQIYDELIKSGYRVWIDFNQMHGNIMDAMAQAIEHSNVILICMSEQYRRSNYCRAEAHYAFQRQLKIVPILLEKHYKPDGWLLFLIGQLLYVDFTKYEFSQAIQMLIKELEAPVLQEYDILHKESISLNNTDNIVTNLPIPLPLPLEKHYKPDGWLLFLIGQLLYVDFTKYEFSQAIQMLIKELEAPVLQEYDILHKESISLNNTDNIVTNLPIPLPLPLTSVTSNNILEWTESEVQDWLIGHNLMHMSRLLYDYNGSSLIYLNKYLVNGDSQEILKLLQEDSLQRTKENLSLVELARFQTLIDEQLLESNNFKQRTKKNNHKHKCHRFNFCQII
ncbi:unnamed protein product [Adineta steineri]|uniref:TIR domain-containing protein n=1 Tax=Adineta steineri TaxID=433720 RepID=A0A814K9H4_9BILA|nr:unnamed protein product [Adineta steineri]